MSGTSTWSPSWTPGRFSVRLAMRSRRTDKRCGVTSCKGTIRWEIEKKVVLERAPPNGFHSFVTGRRVPVQEVPIWDPSPWPRPPRWPRPLWEWIVFFVIVVSAVQGSCAGLSWPGSGWASGVCPRIWDLWDERLLPGMCRICAGSV